jgi:NAD(P)-dependent dehydrogenase (short-subunit alcohol dehydrogenase family)
VTHVVADAASAKAISDLVDQAVREEGHLDFFFANAGITMLAKYRQGNVEDQLRGGARRLKDVPEEEFAEVMRINALRWVPVKAQMEYANAVVSFWLSSMPLLPWKKSAPKRANLSQEARSYLLPLVRRGPALFRD